MKHFSCLEKPHIDVDIVVVFVVVGDDDDGEDDVNVDDVN